MRWWSRSTRAATWCKSVIREADASVPVIAVRATRGKWLRAEPIAALYEQGKVKHAGVFPALEDEMCDFGLDGLSSGRSPDRLDALVWALTHLTLRRESGAAGEGAVTVSCPGRSATPSRAPDAMQHERSAVMHRRAGAQSDGGPRSAATAAVGGLQVCRPTPDPSPPLASLAGEASTARCFAREGERKSSSTATLRCN